MTSPAPNLTGAHRWAVRMEGDPYSWRTASFPALEAEVETEFDGGDQDEVAKSGRPKYGDMTIERGWDHARDWNTYIALERDIRAEVDKVLLVQPLDANRQPIGVLSRWRGRLRTVKHPDTNANETTTPMLSATVRILSRADDRRAAGRAGRV